MTVRIEAAPVLELGPTEIARWRTLQRCHASLANPHFSPDYALLMASVRPDARVAVIEDSAGVQGFFAVQRQRPTSSAAMPLGAPIGDYQGIVGSPNLEVSLPDICKALGIGRLDYARALADQQTFARHAKGAEETWIADVSAGSTKYFADIKARRSQFLYQLGRTRRKLTRERGEAVFTPCSNDAQHLETLLCWKEQQLLRTGQPPVWRVGWVREAITGAMACTDDAFAGVLFTLTADGRLIAANLCLRGHEGLHGVVMAHDSEFDAFSPGLQLLRDILDWAATRGLREVDFGTGEQMYKRQFGTHRRGVVWGWAGTPSLASWSRSAQYALRTQVERIPNKWIANLPGRVMRRMDVYRGLVAPRA
jgi:CelD/BcsL family acetyltransferase involved in cellulose biosynthesis